MATPPPSPGRVVRISGNEVAISTDEIAIPFDLVLAERLFLETGRTGLVMSLRFSRRSTLAS